MVSGRRRSVFLLRLFRASATFRVIAVRQQATTLRVEIHLQVPLVARILDNMPAVVAPPLRVQHLRELSQALPGALATLFRALAMAEALVVARGRQMELLRCRRGSVHPFSKQWALRRQEGRCQHRRRVMRRRGRACMGTVQRVARRPVCALRLLAKGHRPAPAPLLQEQVLNPAPTVQGAPPEAADQTLRRA